MTRQHVLLAMFGGFACVHPHTAHAQQPVPVVGYLDLADPSPKLDEALYDGLKEQGFISGTTVRIVRRSAEGHGERLGALARDLVAQHVAVIAAPGSAEAPLAAKAATSTLPIVFAVGADPVELGLVQSLNRPSGNATGIAYRFVAMAAKRLELLHEIVPNAKTVAVFIDSGLIGEEKEEHDVKAAANALREDIVVLHVASATDLATAFATAVQHKARGVLIGQGPLLGGDLSGEIAALSIRYDLPTVANNREAAITGEVAAYGADLATGFRQVGVYVGRILNGEKPGELPVQQADKFDLVVNLKTAKALGITIPTTLLVQATEVIE